MTVVDAIRQHSNEYSERIAVRDGRCELTYAEFYERVDRLSQAFLAKGVSKGEVILALLPNSFHAIECEIACLQVGAVWVTLHSGLTWHEVHSVVESTTPRIVLIHDELWPSSSTEVFSTKETHCIHVAVSGVSPYANHARHSDYEQLLGAHAAIRPTVSIAPSDPARLRYTSGTTGSAKAAILAHRVYLTSLKNLQNELHALNRTDKVLHAAPLTHASGALVFPILAAGGTNVLLPKFDVETVLKTIERDQITTMFAVPTMLQRMFDSLLAKSTDFSSLRTISYGGAAMSVEALKPIIDRLGPSLLQIYGLTEATHPITTLRHAEHYTENTKLGSIGRVTPFCRIRLVGDSGQDVEFGEVGEIAVAGDNTMSGYWNNSDATNEVLRDGWIFTGDLAYCDEDGYYWIVDRKKDVIISGGFNVYSTEVEHVLSQHPGVLEVAVIGLPHRDWGEVVCAAIVLQDTDSIAGDEIALYCRERLAGYKTPKYFYFLEEALPKNNAGKILKKSLVEQFTNKVIGTR